MWAAILKAGGMIANLLQKTKKVRTIASFAKQSLLEKHRNQEQKEPFFSTFLFIVIAIVVLFVLPILFPVFSLGSTGSIIALVATTVGL